MSTQQFSVANTFGIDVPESITIEGRAKRTPFVPAEASYRFRKDDLSMLGAWVKINNGDGLFITGPTGSGKTSLVQQFCARLNIPLQQVTAHDRLETPELIGHQTIIDGDMVFQDGPLTTAMRHGHWFLLNEADLLDPGTAAGLNDILEGQPLTIAENGGEVIRPHEAFRFIATGNTNGAGDQSGLYSGTTQQNLAFMDRFLVMEVGYMDAETEAEVLGDKVPQLPEDIRKAMVQTANAVRTQFMGESGSDGALEVTMSTRTLVRWAQHAYLATPKAKQGINPVMYALDPALCLRASPETREGIKGIAQRIFGDS